MKEQKERQSKEESLALWSLEKEGYEGTEMSKETAKLMQILDRKIYDYTLTYEEYVNDVVDWLSKYATDSESLEDRKKVINDMYIYFIDKYSNEDNR